MIFRCCLKWISSSFLASNADSSVVAAIDIVSADLSELRFTVIKFIFDCSFICEKVRKWEARIRIRIVEVNPILFFLRQRTFRNYVYCSLEAICFFLILTFTFSKICWKWGSATKVLSSTGTGTVSLTLFFGWWLVGSSYVLCGRLMGWPAECDLKLDE